MADKLRQIREFPQKPDFGDDDLLLIQGQETTYNIRGQAVKKYAEDAAAPQVELARKEAQAAADAANRAEDAIQHPSIPDPVSKNWLVWDQVSEEYGETVPPVRAEGRDFEIKGYYPTLEALEAAVPEPDVGAAYGVGLKIPYDIYVWDAVHRVWVNNGALQGPRGEQGPEGPQGPAGPPGAAGAGIPAGGTAGQVLSKASAEDRDVEWRDPPEGVGRSMAGKTVEPEQGTTVTAGTGAEIFNDYRDRAWGTDTGYEVVVPTRGNIASGSNSHAEGNQTTATGSGAHAEGNGTLASGQCAHAEGGRFTGDVGCIASGYGAHAEGVSTKASASGAHSEGRGTTASDQGAHAEGYGTIASKARAHAEGYNTAADGANSHSEGAWTHALGLNAHAEGYEGIAEGSASHVEGGMVTGKSPNKASGYAAHAEGSSTLASGGESHAEGQETVASAGMAHAEGWKSSATTGYANHAEGYGTTASGTWGAHAEGNASISNGNATHAEGYKSVASGDYAHSEGQSTTASGSAAHAEGYDTQAKGSRSHAEGSSTQALEFSSHAEGSETIAYHQNQLAIGRANVQRTGALSGDYFVVGKGGGPSNRANAFRVSDFGVYGTSAFNSSGADYAELFEWADGNLARMDRTGRFVTLEGENIRLAGPGDGYILGIVSGAPSVVGDVYDDQWQGMYLTDVFGRPIWEDVEVPEVTDEIREPIEVVEPDGSISEVGYRLVKRIIIPAHTERRQKLNPDYDPAQTYVPRSDRPEWDAVGMLGKLVAVDDGSCRVNGWAAVGEGGAATNSEERTKYRVMARLDERHVRILIL